MYVCMYVHVCVYVAIPCPRAHHARMYRSRARAKIDTVKIVNVGRMLTHVAHQTTEKGSLRLKKI